MNSMTAFAQKRFQFPHFTLFFSVKSYNNRYLEISCKGNGLTPAIERMVRELIKNRIFRGKVEIFCDLFLRDAKRWDIQLNEDLLGEIIGRLEAVRKKFRKTVIFSLDTLLKAPMVFHLDSAFCQLDQADLERVQQSINEVIEDFLRCRSEEGEYIAADLLQSITRLQESSQRVANMEDLGQKALFEEYRQRIQRYLVDIPLDERRIIQEAAILSEKSSINEEVNRLLTHIQRLQQLLFVQDAPTKGREADFLCQEILRETHTIAAKTPVLAIDPEIMIIRREVEKIRQQVQNIE